jgi:prepilin-type N-terminal cleavage/methylation domain-containing protein
MNCRLPQHGKATGSYTGFTLVELLISIGIMAILVTFLVAAIAPVLVNARETATKATLKQLDTIIQQRMDVINRLDLSQDAKRLVQLNSSISGSPFNGLGAAQAQALAEFLLRSVLYRQGLPQRPEDLFGFDQTPNTLDDAPYASQWLGNSLPIQVPIVSDGNKYVSSALLYLAVTEGSSIRALPGKSYSLPTLDSEFNSQHLQQHDFEKDLRPSSTAQNPKTILVDSWGEPLRFYNWPTSLIRPNGSGLSASSPLVYPNSMTNATSPAYTAILMPGVSQASLGIDPLDSTVKNSSAVSLNTTPPTSPTANAWGTGQYSLKYGSNAGDFVNALWFNESTFRAPFTFYSPLVISGGADQALGIGEPTATSYVTRLCQVLTPADINDNISNSQQ